MKSWLLLLFLAMGCFGQLIEDAAQLPTNLAAIGAAIGPTRADGAGWAAYARLLHRPSGTYSITGTAVVPALAPAGNGHTQIVLTPTVFSGIQQVVFQRGRVIGAIDGGIGAALPSTGSASFSFSGTYSGTAAIRVSSGSHVVAGVRVSQTPLGFVPTLYGGYGWSW